MRSSGRSSKRFSRRRIYNMRFLRYLFFIAAVVVIWGALQLRPVSSDGEYVSFEVAAGQGAKAVGANLKEEGLIRSRFIFETYLVLLKAETELKAGTYRLSTGDSIRRIIDVLRTGADDSVRQVTLIEGWTLVRYAEYLGDRGFDREEFLSSASVLNLWRSRYDFLNDVPDGATLEGDLFPDTYAVTPARDPQALIAKMLDTFEARIVRGLGGEIAASGEKLSDVVILAS